MSYRPIGERHAIQEVSFSLLFDKPLGPEDVGSINQASSNWKSFLPKIEKFEVIEFFMGPQGVNPPKTESVKPVGYSRVGIDGAPSWMMRFDNTHITVNCRVYTRWDEIWNAARTLLVDAVGALGDPERKFTNISFQVLDVFEWLGKPDDCSPDKIFKIENEFFPNSISRFGPLWHLHMGYFDRYTNDEFPLTSKLLNKVHLNTLRQNEKHLTLIDHNLRLDLQPPILRNEFKNNVESGMLNQFFGDMHQRNKDLISGLLVDEMQERIALNG